jgi:predicted DNA-binding ribbon-helix-helix protein
MDVEVALYITVVVAAITVVAAVYGYGAGDEHP